MKFEDMKPLKMIVSGETMDREERERSAGENLKEVGEAESTAALIENGKAEQLDLDSEKYKELEEAFEDGVSVVKIDMEVVCKDPGNTNKYMFKNNVDVKCDDWIEEKLCEILENKPYSGEEATRAATLLCIIHRTVLDSVDKTMNNALKSILNKVLNKVLDKVLGK